MFVNTGSNDSGQQTTLLPPPHRRPRALFNFLLQNTVQGFGSSHVHPSLNSILERGNFKPVLRPASHSGCTVYTRILLILGGTVLPLHSVAEARTAGGAVVRNVSHEPRRGRRIFASKVR